MEGMGAYGAGKAGGAFDPVAFARRPQVGARVACWLFAVIVFWCISSKGWYVHKETKREQCLLNDDSTACNYGAGVAVIGFLASMGFLAGEYFFEQMSSVKTRKHYVLGDLGFSGFWAFLFFVAFWYLASQWSSAKYPEDGNGVGAMRTAVAFSFFSIFTWAGCAYLAFQRFQQGHDAAFAPSYEVDPAAYPSYPGGPESDQHYQEPPFSAGPNQRAPGDFSAPAY